MCVCVCVCVSERLDKERQILEERAEKRAEILKNLVSRTLEDQQESGGLAGLWGTSRTLETS